MPTRRLPLLLAVLLWASPAWARAPLVLLTDFGTSNGAVSAMKGVAYSVAADLLVSDLTHDGGGIWQAGYVLFQAVDYWPAGTVFVAVVDPGVGTDRLAVVVKTRTGRYLVGPNNGLFTFVLDRDGVEEVRVIDERVNRLPGSEGSHTFHGRDVFGYTGARLAAGVIGLEQVGPRLSPDRLVALPYRRAERSGPLARGAIPMLDAPFGNVWTNVPRALLDQLEIHLGDRVHVRILHRGAVVDEVVAPYRRTFGEVPAGQPLVYLNSLLNVAVALNMASYAERHQVSAGPEWTVELRKE